MNEDLNYTIVKAEYTNPEHTQALLTLRNENGEYLPYFFCPNAESDGTPLSEYLHSQFSKKSLSISVNKESDDAIMSLKVTSKRDALLAETDHYMMEDYPITKEQREEFKTYRQSLRDITKQKSFPSSIEWPKKPTLNEE
jgi:hypothetical protein